MCERPPLKVFPYVFYPASFVAVMWAGYVLEHYFGVTLRGRPVAKDSLVPLWLPASLTPITIGAGYVLYRKAKQLVEKGVDVEAEVTSVAAFGLSGMRDISFRYTYDDWTIEKSKSVSRDFARSLKPGDRIGLIVDPDKPGRYLLKDHLRDQHRGADR
jgi:hypothetical protein